MLQVYLGFTSKQSWNVPEESEIKTMFQRVHLLSLPLQLPQAQMSHGTHAQRLLSE